MMDSADIQALLSSGDVDAVRRMLRFSSQAADASQSRPMESSSHAQAADSVATHLFGDRQLLKIKIGDIELKLRSVRTMGKVLWPAGHAIALKIAALATNSSCSRVALIEVGAGSAVPSLAAAAVGAFRTVVATDCFEEELALIRHNAGLNGKKLTSVARVDVSDAQMLARVVKEYASPSTSAHSVASGDGDGGDSPLLVLACDMSYDPEAILHLFASMRALVDAYPSRKPLLLFARSSNFAHMDTQTRLHAARHGFALLARSDARGSPGVIDSISESHLTPCADDAVSSFFFAPSVTRLAPDAAQDASVLRADLLDIEHEELVAAATAAVIGSASGKPPPLAPVERAVAAAEALQPDPSFRTHPAVVCLLGADQATVPLVKASDPEQRGQARGAEQDAPDDLWAPRPLPDIQ